ncbi:hypothetical protein [Parapedobacter koreensis]|uniref:DUF3592 domain-containing protein n=1 Tax=Parapedobacter koreensis TaxID=332977 RepID=A0A1H7UDR1_9SPHI|nr:hypothetical protein [Parapedobacter koreensis]SEL95202.1 hypothetical protein SAMN05421740_11516 [Parapedobacter koreensis]
MSKKRKRGGDPIFGNWKIHLGTILILFLVGRFIYGASEKTIENYRLANNGKLSNGIVTSRMKVGGKGTISIEYSFQVNHVKYIGQTTNEGYEIGDSLYVIYLPKKPMINRSYTFIKKNYTTHIAP